MLLSLCAYLPQWHLMVKSRSSEGVALKSWLVWLISTALAVFYAVAQYLVHGTGLALVCSTAVSFLFVFTTIYMILRYRARETSEA